MSKIALTPNASGTGTLTIAAPNTSTDRTLTLPDVSGSVVSTGDSATVTSTMLNGDAIPIGVGQTVQNVSASRSLGTTYTNTTGRPIFVIVGCNQGTGGTGLYTQLGSTSFNADQNNQGSSGGSTFLLVPNNTTYQVNTGTGISIGSWIEIR